MDDRTDYLIVLGAYIAVVGTCVAVFIVWDILANLRFLRRNRKGER